MERRACGVREDGSRDQVSRDLIQKVDKGMAHEWANMVGIVNGQPPENVRDRKEDVLSSRRMEKGKQNRKAAALKECRDDFVWPKKKDMSKNGTEDVEVVSVSSSSCVQFPVPCLLSVLVEVNSCVTLANRSGLKCKLKGTLAVRRTHQLCFARKP